MASETSEARVRAAVPDIDLHTSEHCSFAQAKAYMGGVPDTEVWDKLLDSDQVVAFESLRIQDAPPDPWNQNHTVKDDCPGCKFVNKDHREGCPALQAKGAPEVKPVSVQTSTPCPGGCGGFLNAGDVYCPSCRYGPNEQRVKSDSNWCWEWFGPMNHRMKCRRHTGHKGEHHDHADSDQFCVANYAEAEFKYTRGGDGYLYPTSEEVVREDAEGKPKCLARCDDTLDCCAPDCPSATKPLSPDSPPVKPLQYDECYAELRRHLNNQLGVGIMAVRPEVLSRVLEYHDAVIAALRTRTASDCLPMPTDAEIDLIAQAQAKKEFAVRCILESFCNIRNHDTFRTRPEGEAKVTWRVDQEFLRPGIEDWIEGPEYSKEDTARDYLDSDHFTLRLVKIETYETVVETRKKEA